MFEFKRLRKADLALVLKWRTSAAVTDYMFTDVADDFSAHLAWFERIQLDERNLYWIIYYQGQKIGVISQNDIDLVNKRCSWAFYIGDTEYKNLGGLVPPYFYNHVFNTQTISKIIAEVLSHNHQVIKLHKLHGYREAGIWLKHIYKNNNVYDVHLFELHRDDWLAKKRFKKYSALFEC